MHRQVTHPGVLDGGGEGPGDHGQPRGGRLGERREVARQVRGGGQVDHGHAGAVAPSGVQGYGGGLRSGDVLGV